MLNEYIIGGFLSVFTPAVAFWVIFLIIAFNNFGFTTKQFIIALIGFGLIIIGSNVIYGLLIPKSYDLFIFTETNVSFIIFHTVLHTIFALWIIGVIKLTVNKITINRILTLLLILITGIIFSYSALSNTTEIFGNIIVSDMTSDGIIIPLIGFAFGLFISIGLILFLTSGLIKKMSKKKWWKIVKISVGSLFLILVVISLITKINMA